MSERKLSKALFGGLIGTVLGVFLGWDRVTGERTSEIVAPPSPNEIVGWEPQAALRSPHFWIVVVICALAFAFIAGRIGRPTQHSDL